MGLEFIDRTLKTSGVVLLIFLPFGLFYFGVFPALAAFSGGVWGMLNLIFISALVREAIQAGTVDKGKVVGLAVIKFPLLYGSLYGLLKVAAFDPLYIFAGFSSILTIIVLKIVGRSLFRVSERPNERTDFQGAA